jgi:hypothetical protein
MKFTRAIMAASLILLVGGSSTFAFSSVTMWEIAMYYLTGAPAGYIHRQITEQALGLLQVRKDVIDRVGDWNWRTDWDEMNKQWPPTGNEHYNPAHHFDRNEASMCEGCEGKHREAFLRGAKFVAEEKAAAIAGLKGEQGKTADDAIEAMGHGLHALQDLFSHSNIVDLSHEDLVAVEKALLDGSEPPAALKMAGFDQASGGDIAGTPDLCVSGEYGHDTCSKDDQDKNAEAQKTVDPNAGAYDPDWPTMTKFIAAHELAVKFSGIWAEQIRDAAGPAAWQQVLVVAK